MGYKFGKVGPKWPKLGRVARSFFRRLFFNFYKIRRIYPLDSRFAQENLIALQTKINRGETAYIAGIGASGHNSGVSIVAVSQDKGIQLISNDEEERYVGLKHYAEFPEQTIEILKCRLQNLGLSWRDIHAWVATWDFSSLTSLALGAVFEELPNSLPLLQPSILSKWDFWLYGIRMWGAPKRLGNQLGLDHSQPLFASPHHDNHSALAYCLSPFGGDSDPVMVVVLDCFGDEGAISTYIVQGGKMQTIHKNFSIVDSLGVFYTILSSTKGGWTPLSSEGRFMGAAAWGDQDRLTNPFYKRLRELFHFAPEGQIFVNRCMANWQNSGEKKPYKNPLIELLGPPIPREKMWNPDHVLRVDDIKHSEITRERVDIAAATQLVFEDGLFHIIEHLIRRTGSDRLVLSGGTALNCLANMQLLEKFDNGWYRRHLGKNTRLYLWVPPIPGDAGVPPGAAMNFALKAGGRPGEPMRHAFYCGLPPQTAEIDTAISDDQEIGNRKMGNINSGKDLESLTDFMAYILSRDGVVGIYQGSAETGPRALGHRSILANPCNPDSLETINQLVKYRESIRPLAPMATLEAAQELFELSPGAATDSFNAYNYMIMTVLARPLARKKVPAIIHKDGTVRLQIVHPQIDPVCYALLKAMGRRLGAEVAVNTSLNVGSPIVQTPAQALQVLKKAKALTALIMIGADGTAHLTWHNIMAPPKDGGHQLLTWLEEWSAQQHRVSITV